MMQPESDAAFSSTYESPEFLGIDDGSESQRGAGSRGFRINSLWRLVRRNLFLVLLPTVAAGCAMVLLVRLEPKTYSGNFRVLVEPLSAGSEPTQGKAVNESGAETIDYATLVEVLKSPSVLAGILPEIQRKYPTVTFEGLTRKLTVQRFQEKSAEETKILDVVYESGDPEKILFVLDRLQSGYLAFGQADRQGALGGGVAFIEEQLLEKEQRVRELEQQQQRLQQQHQISDLEREGEALAQQARQLEAQQLEAERSLAAQTQLFQNLQAQLGQTPQQVVQASSLSENPRYQALLDQLKEIEAQIATESARFQPEFPAITTLQVQRDNLKQLLNQESQRLIGTSNGPQFQNSLQKTLSQQMLNAQNEVEVLRIRANALKQASAAIAIKIQQFPNIQRQYNDLQTQLEVSRNSLKQLQAQLDNLQVESAQQELPWRLLSGPQLLKDSQGNLMTSSQKGLQKLLLATLGGFVFGIGCAILKERRRDVFYTPEDLQEDVRLPVMGVFQNLVKRKSQARLLPFGAAADALYSNLRFLPVEPHIRSLVITSYEPLDGKTLVVIELAKAVAAMGQRVLVVDANMVTPQVHSHLEVSNFEGLNEILANAIDPNQFIQRSPQHSNLFVLPSGQVSRLSHKLVASQQMQHLMAQLHTMYDFVVYDTPPLQTYADANFLSLHVGGLLLVVSLKKTPRSQVLRLVKTLRHGRLPLLGTVANRAKEALPGQDIDRLQRSEHFSEELDLFRVSAS